MAEKVVSEVGLEMVASSACAEAIGGEEWALVGRPFGLYELSRVVGERHLFWAH